MPEKIAVPKWNRDGDGGHWDRGVPAGYTVADPEAEMQAKTVGKNRFSGLPLLPRCAIIIGKVLA